MGLRPVTRNDEAQLPPPLLMASVIINHDVYYLRLQFDRMSFWFVSDDPKTEMHSGYATVWETFDLGKHGAAPTFILSQLDRVLDRFLDAYLKANVEGPTVQK